MMTPTSSGQMLAPHDTVLSFETEASQGITQRKNLTEIGLGLQAIEGRDKGAAIGAVFFGMLLSLGVVAKTGHLDYHIGQTKGEVVAIVSFVAMSLIALLTITCYLKHEPIGVVDQPLSPSQLEEKARKRDAEAAELLKVKSIEVIFFENMINSYARNTAKEAARYVKEWSRLIGEEEVEKHLGVYLKIKLEEFVESPLSSDSIYKATVVGEKCFYRNGETIDRTQKLYYWLHFVGISMDLLLDPTKRKEVPPEAYDAAKVMWAYNGELC